MRRKNPVPDTPSLVEIETYRLQKIQEVWGYNKPIRHAFDSLQDFTDAALKFMQEFGYDTKEQIDAPWEWAHHTWYRRTTLL